MTHFVRNAWYCAAWATEVRKGELFTRRVLDEPVVMYRISDGTAVAMLDRCPHKLLPLSLGNLMGDRLQCGYHGLQFDCSGRCVHVPGQDKIPPTARTRVFPLVERYNALWIWMGDPALADSDRIIDVKHYGEPGWAVIDGQYQYHRSNYLNIAENLVDPAHTTYVHTNTIGNPAGEEVPVSIDVGRTDSGVDYVLAHRWVNGAKPTPIDSKLRDFKGLVDRCQYYYYYLPSVSQVDMVAMDTGQEHSEENKNQGLRAFSYKFITPESDTRTHFFWMQVRNYRTSDEDVQPLVDAMNATFEEDNVIVSAVQRQQEEAGVLQQTWLRIDAAPTRVRKLLEKMAAAEQEQQQSGAG